MITCDKCKGQCCKTLAVQLETPTTYDDYEDIFWYLYHEGAWVYIDMDDEWWIQFPSKCSKLDKNGLCTKYENRPPVCRKAKLENCEVNKEEIKIIFKNEDDYKDYFESIKEKFEKKKNSRK
ncbi:YkgJ family cysteine cluster protein [Candidatus Woesearchaeota archaeon]|nr:YkgJ family cysteine cluster protein [Candidatus Woesearchaeota archaeon]MBT5272970.1 YkgJ family cysteine cluster protein [Candidatus Woesearchaeota archaeon]MBT6041436.1 YkgJ family cysteine cluster protein [Candidatus Woesearchaeota archaeon]MBT6337319.1 YkgJ family cysteine cluster protein [Candidatus Woesearchaeota archaeon]MBT7927196.1 YkgJ family cysteine cluster protein [Candidatus Woesearchaeota archaeon]